MHVMQLVSIKCSGRVRFWIINYFRRPSRQEIKVDSGVGEERANWRAREYNEGMRSRLPTENRAKMTPQEMEMINFTGSLGHPHPNGGGGKVARKCLGCINKIKISGVLILSFYILMRFFIKWFFDQNNNFGKRVHHVFNNFFLCT